MDKRKTLTIGSKLFLGTTEYEIRGIAGAGSNAIVYKASYKDEVEQQYDHHVLVKELFPWEKEGKIYRKEDGSIYCSPDKKDFFEMHEKSYREGNKIHLSYLETHPEATSGNINSWYQNGTIYTVYSFEGGVTLEEWREKKAPDIKTCCKIMEKLVDEAETFYQAVFLHLDISPDNILIVNGTGEKEERLILIDFNCSWNIKERKKDISVYTGKKDGYSAPEVLLNKTEYFGQCSDLYSICAICFYMIVGRKMNEDEQENRKIRMRALEKCPSLQEIPQTAMHLLKHILCRGLAQSPSVRYQNGIELKYEIREFADRLEKRGITRAVLWEISRDLRKKFEKQVRQYQYESQMYLQTEQMQNIDEDIFWKEVMETKENILLLGEGGAGKTGILFRAWQKNTETYQTHDPVIFYIPLSVCQGEEGKVLQSYILEKIRPGKSRETEEFICLSRILDFEGPFVFLLDGFDEAVKRRELAKEIQELSQKEGVQIVLSERKKTFLKWQREVFRVYRVLELEREQKQKICIQNKIEMPEDPEIEQLLGNRMFMGMYIDIMVSSDENSEKERTKIRGIEKSRELFERYYKGIQEKIDRKFLWEEAENFAAEYALKHFLPIAAFESEKRKSRLLEGKVMVQLAEQSYQKLKEKAFLFSFPEYMEKGARICSYFQDFWQWYDFTVNKILFDELKLLQKSEEGWRISHQILCYYLAEKGKINKSIYLHSRWKILLKKNIRIIAAGMIVCILGFKIWTETSYPFWTKDKKKVEESITNMALVAGSAYYVLEEGYSILEQAQDMIETDFLERDYEYWNSQMEKRMESCSFYAGLYEEAVTARYLPLVWELKIDVDKEEIKELYTVPREYFSQIQKDLSSLSVRLDPANQYTDYDKKNIVELCLKYLDGCTDLLNWTTASVLSKYPKEYRQQYEAMLQDYPLHRSIHETEEKIQSEIKNVEKVLEDIERELRLNGM